MNCKYCQKRDYLLENALAYAKFDENPTVLGQMVVVPKRHVTDYSYLTEEEKVAMHQLVDMAKDALAGIYAPSDYDLSTCEADGQHLSFSLVPKYMEASNSITEIA